MKNIPSENHPNCIKCQLFKNCDNPFIGIDGSYDSDVLFVGEAPGAEEDEQGKPFIGKSGKLLREMVEALEIDASYTNSVRCRPPENATPTGKQIELCKEFLTEDLENSNSKVIVPLGNVALKAVTGNNGITAWRGKVLKKDSKIYVATYHPAALLYSDDDGMEQSWMEDLDKIAGIAVGDSKDSNDKSHEYEYKLIESVSEFREVIKELKNAGEAAYDTEFTNIKIYSLWNDLIMASFAIKGKAWAIPIFHPESNMLDDLPEIIDIFEDFCNSDIRKIGHNIKIDALIPKTTLGIDLLTISDDVMLLSQLVDSNPRSPHDLKELAERFLGWYDYEADLTSYVAEHKNSDPKRGGTYANIPLDILWVYAAKDAAATYSLRDILKDMLDEKQLILYKEMIIPAISTFATIENNGCLLDEKIIGEYRTIYENEMNNLYNEMRKHPAVIELEEKLLNKANQARKIKKLTEVPFNPNSGDQVSEIIFGGLGYKPTIVTSKGRGSVAADAIKNIDDPWVNIYSLYTLYSSANSKYLTKMPSWIRGDGRIRSTYNIVGTETGRTSSHDPNLQNIPTPEKQPDTLLEKYPIKNVFVNTFLGGCLYTVDYSAAEMRMMATLSQAKELVNMFVNRKDPHTFVASKLYKIPEEDVPKEKRYRAKWVNWTMLFGGGIGTLMETYGLSKKEATELYEGWYSIFPEVAEFNAEQIKFAHKYGYTVSPYGKKRHFPDLLRKNNGHEYTARLEREAVNHPIQSSASDTLVISLTIIDAIMQSHRMKSLIINTVHDSITFDVYPGELESLNDVVIDVMQNVKDYASEYCPNIDFSWLKIPLVADAEIGTHYGSLIKYEEYMKEKDKYEQFKYA